MKYGDDIIENIENIEIIENDNLSSSKEEIKNSDEKKKSKDISQSKKKKKIRLIISIIIILIILIGAIIFVVIFFKKKRNNIFPTDTVTNTGSDINTSDSNDIITPCLIGDTTKCLICNPNNNECIKCYLGYKLLNGKCKINYSFKVLYQTNIMNENITLINSEFIDHIIEMNLELENETFLPINSINYTFSEIGYHTIYFLMEENILSFRKMFDENINIISFYASPLLNTNNILTISSIFHNCINLKSVDLFYFNTQNLRNMSTVFFGCYSLTSINISSFNTQNVNYMSDLFTNCFSLTSIDLSHFNTQNVKDMGYMFCECHSLTSVDISNFNTKNVISFSGMFDNCYSLKSINISHFNTHNAEIIYNMFSGCSSLTVLNLSNFETENVREMQSIFKGCSKLNYLDISLFSYNDNIIDISDEYSNLFVGLPSSGTIIINQNFHDKIYGQIPNGWKKIIKN